MKKFFTFLFLFVVFSPLVYGASFESKERVSLSPGVSVRDNFYVAGGEVTISGEVLRDLVALGGEVTITGEVGEDLLIGGGVVNILGNVDQDVRVGGGKILIAGEVLGDLLAGGGDIHILPTANIYQDAILGGGKIVIDGDVKGDVVLGAKDVVINGEVLGNIEARVSGDITLGKDAVIYGNITYFARNDLKIEEGASILGNVTFNKMEVSSLIMDYDILAKGLFAVLGIFLLVKLLAILLVGFCLIWMFKKFSSDLVEVSIKNFWREVLRGFIILIVTPVLAVLFLLTIVGGIVTVVILLTYILLLVLASIYSGVVFGSVLFKYMTKQKTITVNMVNGLSGIVILYLLGLIPLIGWIILGVFCLSALGAVSSVLYKKIK